MNNLSDVNRRTLSSLLSLIVSVIQYTQYIFFHLNLFPPLLLPHYFSSFSSSSSSSSSSVIALRIQILQFLYYRDMSKDRNAIEEAHEGR